jgi:uncharacterized repeat protein (TIGR02543 family)
MPLLRIIILLVFAALSIARAACSDFEIFADHINTGVPTSLGCVNNINLEIYYRTENLTLSVSPMAGGTPIWRIEGVPAHNSFSYTQMLGEHIGNKTQTITYTVEKDGATKTIILTIKSTKFTISFDTQSDSPKPPNLPVILKEPVGELPPAPTKTGYTFKGWFSAATGGVEYTAQTIYSTEENITLYAQWTPNQYTISFDTQGGSANPQSKTVEFGSAIGTLTTPTKMCLEFAGWFSAATGGKKYTSATTYDIASNATFYAQWINNIPKTPTKDLLDYYLPLNLAYNAAPIAPITVSPKSGICPISSNITTYYDNSTAPPKDVGTYEVYASVESNENYKAEKILLGSIEIKKADVNFAASASAKDKEFDGTTTATLLAPIVLTPTPALFGSDAAMASDYTVSANFASANAGAGIAVTGTINWLPNCSLCQNYKLSPINFTTYANITKATGFLQIEAPEIYELSNPVTPTARKNPFIKDSDITWEYRKKDGGDYSTNLPNKIGNWIVRASFEGTTNYTSAADSVPFLVSRGNAIVASGITFSDAASNNIVGFAKDTALSKGTKNYYTADASLCEIENIKINITLFEEGVILKVGNEAPRPETDENGFNRYEIAFPNVRDTLKLNYLIYSLITTDGTYNENDTLLIGMPIPFDTVVKQKWNNVLLVNNNPKTNGGYEFTDFKWFKNGEEVNKLQFYSAGPSSKDILNPTDVYNATMHTVNRLKFSTCQGNPVIVSAPAAKPAAPALQVLGINGKTAKSNSKVYNLNGKLAKETPAGIYVVEDNIENK